MRRIYWLLTVVACFVAGTGLGQCGQSAEMDQCLLGGKFRVDIGGVETEVTSFSGGGVTFDKREVTGGNHPGSKDAGIAIRGEWQNIIIERNYSVSDRSWEDWYRRAAGGVNLFKNVTLTYLDSEGAEARFIDYQNCWPIRYDRAAIADTCAGAMMPIERLVLRPRDAYLDALPRATPGPSCLDELCSFEMAIGSGGSADSGWTEFVATDVARSYRVTVRGPMTVNRRALCDWINSTAKGKRERVDMPLAFKDDSGQPVAAYELFQCIPISYQLPAVSSGNYEPLEESVTLHVMKVVKK